MRIRTVVTTIEEGFCLPHVDKFEKLINERTKAILICNPNNPTDYLYTQREMNWICDFVKRYNLYLFSDEVYREFIYTGFPYISAMQLEGIEQHVVLIDSVSKCYSEYGIRIGAFITKNEQVSKTFMKFCQAYDEYVKRRKCMIDGVNRTLSCYTLGAYGRVLQGGKTTSGWRDDYAGFCCWILYFA